MFKKIILSAILVFSLSFGFAVPAFADDITPPQEPNIENLNVDEANQLINNYNNEVDTYNSEIQVAYEQQCAEVDTHNNLEAELVEQNELDLQQYEQDYAAYQNEVQQIDAYNARQDRLKAAYDNAVDAQEARIALNQAQAGQGITENVTTDISQLPTSYEGNSEEIKTILIEESENPSGKTYQIINLHLYLAEGYYSYDGSYSNNETFTINEEMLSYVLLAKWEVATADYNDIVTVVNEGAILPTSEPDSMMFYNYISDDYLNGYWYGGSELHYTSNYVEEKWINGTATSFSYVDGAHYNQFDNVFSLYTYNWMQYPTYSRYTPVYKDYPEEPEKIYPYIPNYFVYPDDPLYLSHLDYLIADDVTSPTDNPVVERPQNIVPLEEVTAVEENVVTHKGQKDIFSHGNSIIEDNPSPLASNIANTASSEWALLNLILMLITVALLLVIFKNKKYSYYNNIVTVTVALVSIITFILTENIYNKMIIIDQYTWIMLLLCCLGILSKFILKKKNNEETE